MAYKLSPSDFKYLWEDCKHCYYLKVKEGLTLPSMGFPSIFNHMSGLLQQDLVGRNTSELNAGLPEGTFTQQEGYMKSAAIPPSQKTYISGRFDLMTEFSDGTHGVIDMKMIDPKEDAMAKFDRQLHAYKFALENPLEGGNSVEISKLGLMVYKPEKISLHKGYVYYRGKPVWYEIKINMDGFFSFISEVETLLEGPVPDPTAACAWCRYRGLTKPAS